MKKPKTLLCGGWDINKFFDELMEGVEVDSKPMSDEEWAEWEEWVEGMAKELGLSDEEKSWYLTRQIND